MDIRSYIKDLLYLHDCVIIPGFGGFVTGYQASEIHKYWNLIYPPSKTILFNRRLQTNDGVFINHLAQQENMDYRSAEETIKQFSIWWNRQLESKGVVTFPEVGKLYINSGNVLVFLPELRKNYLLDTFGLKPIAFYPQMEVVSVNEKKGKQTEPMDEAEYAERLRIKRKRRTQLAVAAALIGALLLIPQLFLQNLLPEKIRIEQLNVFDFFNTPDEVAVEEEVKMEDASKENKNLIDKTAEEEKPAITNDAVPAETTKTENHATNESLKIENYYIILGSYGFISDAIRNKKIFESRNNKTVEVFPSKDGSYLVGIAARGSKESAESSLPAFTTDELKPWLILRE